MLCTHSMNSPNLLKYGVSVYTARADKVDVVCVWCLWCVFSLCVCVGAYLVGGMTGEAADLPVKKSVSSPSPPFYSLLPLLPSLLLFPSSLLLFLSSALFSPSSPLFPSSSPPLLLSSSLLPSSSPLLSPPLPLLSRLDIVFIDYKI